MRVRDTQKEAKSGSKLGPVSETQKETITRERSWRSVPLNVKCTLPGFQRDRFAKRGQEKLQAKES